MEITGCLFLPALMEVHKTLATLKIGKKVIKKTFKNLLGWMRLRVKNLY